MQNGYWILSCPMGYTFETRKGHGKVLTRSEPEASQIQEALEGFASDRFGTPAEVKAFLESQPEPIFPKNQFGQIHMQRVIDLLNRKLYSGYYDYPDWNIGLTEGKHERLIDYDTFQKIQDKLHGRAKVPMRRDLHMDFPLRGFVCCDHCNVPMKSCWTQGKYQKYPYYLCQTKGCALYGKSIGRETIEGAFEDILKKATPEPDLLRALERKVFDDWLDMADSHQAYRKGLEQELKDIERKTNVFLERIGMADSATLITGYERQITQLESRRVVLTEKIAKCGTVNVSHEDTTRTLFDIIGDPHKHWTESDLPGKRILLKLVFAEQLRYRRNEGYRTPAKSLPYRVLEDLSRNKSLMAHPERLELPTSRFVV